MDCKFWRVNQRFIFDLNVIRRNSLVEADLHWRSLRCCSHRRYEVLSKAVHIKPHDVQQIMSSQWAISVQLWLVIGTFDATPCKLRQCKKAFNVRKIRGSNLSWVYIGNALIVYVVVVLASTPSLSGTSTRRIDPICCPSTLGAKVSISWLQFTFSPTNCQSKRTLMNLGDICWKFWSGQS